MNRPRFLLCFPRLQFGPSDTVKPDGSLSLPYLAGSLRRAGFDVSILDCAVGDATDDLQQTFFTPTPLPSGLVRVGLSDERIVQACADYDVIGLTSIFTMQTTQVEHMVRLIRAAYPEKYIILGGVNARALQARFFDAGADIIFTSEADHALCGFAETLAETGKLPLTRIPGTSWEHWGANPIGSLLPVDLDALAMPAWDLLPLARYWAISRPHGGDFLPGQRIQYGSMMTSRGCPFSCSYCHISKETPDSPSGDLRSLRVKSLGRVVDEIDTLKSLGVTHVFLEDDSLLAKKARAMQIFAAIADRGLTLIDVNGVNLAHLVRKEHGKLVTDRPLLEAMAHAGFTQLTLPFESGSQRILDKYASSKWRLDLIDTDDLIRACNEVGITPLGNFTIGYPDEPFDEVLTTIDFARRCVSAGLKVASFFLIVPFPGTQLFDDALAQGYLRPDWNPDDMNWNRSLFQHAKVSPETLEAIRAVAWRTVNRPEFVSGKMKLAPTMVAA